MDVEEIIKAISMLWNNRTYKINQRPQIIIETGTLDGMGTTQWVIQGFKRSQASYANRPRLITIEVNANNVKKAGENLRDQSWVTIVHGCSVDHAEAYEFMLKDELMKNPGSLRIDSDNPISFYYKEITAKFDYWGMTDSGESNLLEKLIDKYKNHRPLFLLDGAGGIGYLEFQKVVEGMGSKRFFIFVKDIDHIKHYRTYQHIVTNENKRWEVIGTDHENWILAVCRGASGK